MNILALNSSPRAAGVSKTGLLLDALTKGMTDAGATVETVNLRDKKIRNCMGCFTCWSKTPGVCVFKDDMSQDIFPKWLAADLVVYATPLYHFTVNATMKALIERTLPFLEPFLVTTKGGKTTHPMRQKPPKAVALSVAGFPEMAVFDQLSSYMKFLFRGGLVGEIYRPSAESVMRPNFRATARDILEATALAGRELVQSMKVSEETMARITQPVGHDFDSIAKMANAFWKTCIREGVTPREFTEKGMIPRPDSIETFLMIMEMGFNPSAAAGVKAAIQFNFSGGVEGACHLSVDDGKLLVSAGPAPKPDLTVETPFDLWMDIMTGKADGQEMFMRQMYRINGDLSLMLRMKDLFGQKKE